MDFIQKNIVALVAIVIAIGGYMYPQVQSAVSHFGGTTNYDALQVSKLTVGASGVGMGQFSPTTCNLIGTDASQAASSSKAYDCAVTGITSGDPVIALIATSTTANAATGAASLCPGWQIVGAKASTTAGYATVILANNSCGAAVPSATSVGSSTNIWFAHLLSSTPGL